MLPLILVSCASAFDRRLLGAVLSVDNREFRCAEQRIGILPGETSLLVSPARQIDERRAQNIAVAATEPTAVATGTVDEHLLLPNLRAFHLRAMPYLPRPL